MRLRLIVAAIGSVDIPISLIDPSRAFCEHFSRQRTASEDIILESLYLQSVGGSLFSGVC